MQITTFTPTSVSQATPQKQPKFGHLASKKEFREIQNIAGKLGIESSALNPNFTLVNNQSRIPFYNFFRWRIPNLLALKKAAKEYGEFLQGDSIRRLQQPLMIVLQNFPTQKSKNKFLAITPKEELKAIVSGLKKIDPQAFRGRTDDEIAQYVSENSISYKKYESGPKQMLILLNPKGFSMNREDFYLIIPFDKL